MGRRKQEEKKRGLGRMRVREWGEQCESPERYFVGGTSLFQAETEPKHCWVWAGLAWASVDASGEAELRRSISWVMSLANGTSTGNCPEATNNKHAT